ncbi:MAG: hypothetical protein ACK54Z_08215 [Cyanobacteriota bacterium]
MVIEGVGAITISLARTAVVAQAPSPTSTTKVVRLLSIRLFLK